MLVQGLTFTPSFIFISSDFSSSQDGSKCFAAWYSLEYIHPNMNDKEHQSGSSWSDRLISANIEIWSDGFKAGVMPVSSGAIYEATWFAVE
ncbi:hypothetical protein [Chengkuizengella sediminis]|uniref:hypothetical protein n=1 Tax=Chengkuizengella sediminis TaxID=1885917 RepID=UPI001389BCCE|nr:hypothetical protein [Chengkuizengella sediminis]NDI35663.1 hypothetical protein [Chengkuizengella sediminis]